MRLRERVCWIGSGILGMNATDDYDCNVYLLDGGSEWAIVDCGSGYGVPRMLEEAERDGCQRENIAYVLLTHAHMDHAGGAAALRRALPNARFVASPATADLLEAGNEAAIGLTEARASGIYPEDCVFEPCQVELRVREGERLAVGDLTLDIVETPGHAFDMVNYYCPELGVLFCGDAVFEDGRVALQTTPDFSLAQLEQSILKLERLDVDSLLPGHYSPVLRGGGRPIRRAAQIFRNGGVPPSIV